MTPVATANTMVSGVDERRVWRQAISVLIFLSIFILFLYRETAISMVTIWARSDTFAHAFLVPPIVFWLVWRKRNEIALQNPHAAMSALPFVAGAAFLWYLGELASVNAVTQLSFVAILVLTVPAALGWPLTRLI